jgi:DNA helicase-2/ATP-dependent DNA helicase PcrA
VVEVWQPEPEPDAVNPALADPPSATWPAEAAADARQVSIRQAGALVEAAARELATGAAATPRPAATLPTTSELAAADPAGEAAALAGRYQALTEAWARDADLLLAERERRQAGQDVLVSLPRQLPVSSLVSMARDPGELAQQVRRPMPRRPAPQAARGTTFHQWLEQRYGQAQLIDADDLPGAADDLAARSAEPELAELQARFEASEWASRWPVEVEVPFETKIGDRLVRGRIDAVFADPDGGATVVDWKTGEPPRGAEAMRQAAVQLAAYRLAWAALSGVPESSVRTAFYYVRGGTTVAPDELPDPAELAELLTDAAGARPVGV